MVKLAIVGAGHLGQQMAHYAKFNTVEIIGFFDDTFEKGEEVFGLPILGGLNDINPVYSSAKFSHIIIGIGYNHLACKAKLWGEINDFRIPFYSIICPNTYIDKSAVIYDGAFIMPGVVVDQRCVVGKGVVLNCNTTISHDSVIGDFSFFGPAVTLSGFVKIGKETFLGSGSVIIDNVSIVNQVKIGAGAVVSKNINEVGLYLGIPAKKSTNK
jgi:sugar O-acyltransferase (sialic acid O-acetyltransferase NeuD family)